MMLQRAPHLRAAAHQTACYDVNHPQASRQATAFVLFLPLGRVDQLATPLALATLESERADIAIYRRPQLRRQG
jgi:hypothetical protein